MKDKNIHIKQYYISDFVALYNKLFTSDTKLCQKMVNII